MGSYALYLYVTFFIDTKSRVEIRAYKQIPNTNRMHLCCQLPVNLGRVKYMQVKMRGMFIHSQIYTILPVLLIFKCIYHCPQACTLYAVCVNRQNKNKSFMMFV